MKSFVLKIFLYIFLTLIISDSIAYILRQPVVEAEKNNLLFNKLMWNQFYALPNNKIDVLLLGSSHAYRSFNPFIIDSITKENSFVVGSPDESPVTSYYMLKEALLTQSPKTIVLENYFFPLFYETSQLQYGSFVYDNMRNSPVKKEFFENGFNLYDKCALTFAPLLRYKNNLYMIKTISKNELVATDTKYIDKGYVESRQNVKKRQLYSVNLFDDYVFDSSKINANNIKYFKKIITLCKEHNMRIIVFTSPVPMVTYAKIKNPADLDIYFNNLCKLYDVEYYNCLNPSSLNLNSDSLNFSNFHHLNKNGADVVSKKVGEIINSKL